jgi:hypothetical protein
MEAGLRVLGEEHLNTLTGMDNFAHHTGKDKVEMKCRHSLGERSGRSILPLHYRALTATIDEMCGSQGTVLTRGPC